MLPWYVSSETLAAWADSYVAAARLPELVRRLILLSTQVEEVHFPGGKQVYSSGFDGAVVSASGSAFVPKGHSVWELSTRQDALKKARKDVAKRAPAVAESTGIVCVSLRQVPGGDAWAKEQSERLGRHIRFLDADSLATWLSSSAVMGLYLLRPAGPPLRTTKDVDCITTVSETQHAIKLGKLVTAGTLTPERDVLCRYRSSTGDFMVDVLDISGTTTGGINRWFAAAVEHALWWDAGDGVQVRAITPPYFVLTKLVSLQDARRTEGHALYHHDLIDIVTVLTEVADFQVKALPLLADLRREVETLCGIAKDLEPDLIIDACHAEASVKPLLEWLGF